MLIPALCSPSVITVLLMYVYIGINDADNTKHGNKSTYYIYMKCWTSSSPSTPHSAPLKNLVQVLQSGHLQHRPVGGELSPGGKTAPAGGQQLVLNEPPQSAFLVGMRGHVARVVKGQQAEVPPEALRNVLEARLLVRKIDFRREAKNEAGQALCRWSVPWQKVWKPRQAPVVVNVDGKIIFQHTPSHRLHQTVERFLEAFVRLARFLLRRGDHDLFPEPDPYA